ncbi:unnamed protein product [Schistosoma margrebowiei]|uniref:Uncharacterized protein n=1 Tax=Schistosoma margrebowiei TaxID=48269 RepID=A0A183NA41_9TREM|nr:unnamed protein product [Schistosoma margrebowiei]
MAIRQINNVKATGPDNITVEAQKADTTEAAASTSVGLEIQKGKRNILPCNTACINTFTFDGKDLEDGKTFTYLSIIIDEHGESDVKAKIGKARAAYLQMKSVGQTLHYQQQHNVGKNKRDFSGGRNHDEAPKVDTTHIEQSIQLRRNANLKAKEEDEDQRPNYSEKLEQICEV